jgi:hypothetical protein
VDAVEGGAVPDLTMRIQNAVMRWMTQNIATLPMA